MFYVILQTTIMNNQTIFNYNVFFQEEPKGGYTVKVPTLPGCITYGKTLEEAQKMAQKAIKAYITSLKKHGEPVPSDKTVFITTLSLNFPTKTRKKVHV